MELLLFFQLLMMWGGQESPERVGIARIEGAQYGTLHRLDEQSPVVTVQRHLHRVSTDRVDDRVGHRRGLAGTDRVKDVLIRPPVQVNRALADTRSSRQLVDGYTPIAPRQQQLSGGIEDAIRPFLSIGAWMFYWPFSREGLRHCIPTIRFWSIVTVLLLCIAQRPRPRI